MNPELMYVRLLQDSGFTPRTVGHPHASVVAVTAEGIDYAHLFDPDTGRLVRVVPASCWRWHPVEIVAKAKELAPGQDVVLESIQHTYAICVASPPGSPNRSRPIHVYPKFMLETPESRAAALEDIERRADAQVATWASEDRQRAEAHTRLNAHQRRLYDQLSVSDRRTYMRDLEKAGRLAREGE